MQAGAVCGRVAVAGAGVITDGEDCADCTDAERLALWLVVFVLVLLVLGGCVRGEEEPLAWRVYVPAVAHDCSVFICGEVARREALIACELEMVRLRVEENRPQLVEDCAEFRVPEDPEFREGLK